MGSWFRCGGVLVTAVAAVHAHAVKPNAELALVADTLERELRLGQEVALVLGEADLCAALRVVVPNFGQIEAEVAEGGLLAAGEAGADGYLAVFDLAEPPVVLPGHADGNLALLGERGVVNDEPAVGGGGPPSRPWAWWAISSRSGR